MTWLAVRVHRIWQRAFFRGKVMAKKSPKQQEVAKMLGFLSPLQAVEIAREATTTCCMKISWRRRGGEKGHSGAALFLS